VIMLLSLNKQYKKVLLIATITGAQESPKSDLRFKRCKGFKTRAKTGT
jgi:hypothetical protein